MSIEWTQPSTSAAAGPALWELPEPIPQDAPAAPAYTPPIEAFEPPMPAFAPPMPAFAPPMPAYGPSAPHALPTQAYDVPTQVHALTAPAAPAPRPTASAEHPLQIASLGRRLGAYVLDVMLLAVGGVLIAGFDAALGLTETANRGDGSAASAVAGVAYVLIVSLIQFAYFATPAFRKGGGQTLGKRALGIRFVRTDGSAAGAGLALGRSAALIGPSAVLGAILMLTSTSAAFAPAALLGLVLLIAYPIADLLIAPLVGLGRQTLHDRMARSVVVDAGATASVPSAAPATIVGRARTGATWAFSGTMSVAIVGLVLLVLALAALGARAAAEYDSLQAPDTYDTPYSYS